MKDSDIQDSTRPIVYLEIMIDRQFIGQLHIELFNDVTPRTAENFRRLCVNRTGSTYRLSTIHRIIKNFGQQGGSIASNPITNSSKQSDIVGGAAAAEIYDMETLFDDENTLMPHLERGMVSIANCGKHTNSTQFFITFQKASYLDGLNVVCGKVTEDTLHILNILESIGVSSDGFYIRSNRVVITDCGEVHESTTQQDKCNTVTLR